MTGSFVLDGATQAMIASLPTQEERDRLTRFLTVELQDGKGTGILGDVFLVLKANRCYMEKLPGQFNRELVQPIQGHTLRMEKTFATQIDTQKQIATQNERTTTRSIEVMDRMDSIIPKVENVVQRSVDKVDTKALTQQITATLFESTVEPVRMTNLELLRMANILTDLIDKAKEVFDMLRKIAWRQILLGSLGITFVFWFVVYILAYQGMKHTFNASLQEQNQKLLELTAAIPKVQSALAARIIIN